MTRVWPLTLEQRRALTLAEVACGTPEGYRLHRHQHSIPCGPCSWAWDASPGCTPVRRDVCGTNDGWTAHRKQQEWPCAACAEAREAYELELCGTLAGWNIHRRNGSVICDRCTAAVRDYGRALRAAVRRPVRSVSAQERAICPATLTGRLRRAQLAGAVLVCAKAPFEGCAVLYAPRSPFDKYTWRIVSAPAHHVTAADLRAVGSEEED